MRICLSTLSQMIRAGGIMLNPRQRLLELEVSIVTDFHKIQIPAVSVLGYKRRPDIKFIVPWRTVYTVRYFVILDKLRVGLLVGRDQDVCARMTSFCRTTLPKTQPIREKDLLQ